MGLFLVPAIGFGLWLVHLFQTLSGRGARWGWWAWFLGLPVLCGGVVFYWFQFVPPPENTHIWATTRVANLCLGNLAFGLLEWFAFLLLEPFLVLAVRGMRWLELSSRANEPSGSLRE